MTHFKLRLGLRLHLNQNLLQNQFKQVTVFLDLSQLIVSFSSYGKILLPACFNIATKESAVSVRPGSISTSTGGPAQSSQPFMYA